MAWGLRSFRLLTAQCKLQHTGQVTHSSFEFSSASQHEAVHTNAFKNRQTYKSSEECMSYICIGEVTSLSAHSAHSEQCAQ